MSYAEKFLWVCELNKENPTKKWKAGDIMELEDDDDRDYVINSLILKTAVLGAKAVDNERNLVSIRLKGHKDVEYEQPIFSLTLGRNDMVSGLDLCLASDHNQDVEFKLIEGTGPVFITCTHMIELPTADEQQTIMTNSEADLTEELDDDEELQDETEINEADKSKNKRVSAVSLKNGIKNGKMKNGDQNGIKKDEAEEMEAEKPTKRRRN